MKNIKKILSLALCGTLILGILLALASCIGSKSDTEGTCTVVTDGDETYLVNRGCAGMATAGSGDVLSGILAGLLGYALPTPLTVACGAYLAGLAGELAERDVNPISMLASDTVAHISKAITEITASFS